VTTHEARLVDTLLWLCSIPSPTGEEHTLAAALEQRLGANQRLAGPPRRIATSLVVPVTRGTGGPHVVLAGHTDVVRTSHDGPPRVEGDRLFGPGASDMKSGLAVMLDLLEDDEELSYGVDLTFVLYAREEGPFADNELGLVLDQASELRGADFALCLEPSDNKLSVGASGSLHAEVIFRGRTAHSARPWQGDNAIHKAGALLVELGAGEPIEHAVDGFVYRAVTSATLAEGGRGRNVIPDELRLNLNHRFPPGTSTDAARAHVEGLVGGRAEVIFRDVSPSAPTFPGAPARRALAHVGRARGRAQAGVDRRGPVRVARHPGGELRAGRQRAGAPAERVDEHPPARRGPRHLGALPAPRRRASARQAAVILVPFAGSRGVAPTSRGARSPACRP
jgi:succinyl-diaminopimelate desuccinylase